MATDGEKIEVQLGANVGNLQAGMETAATSVDAGTAQMIALLEKLVAASATSTEEIIQNEKQLAAAVEESSEESASSMALMAERIKETTSEAKESLEGFAHSITGVQKTFALLAEVATLGFIGEQVIDLGKEFGEFAEQTEIAGQKTGLSTGVIQELGFAAKMTGTSAESMNQSMARLSRTMANAQQGSVQAEAAFKSVGLSAEQLADMPLDQVLGKVADAFAASEDGAAKAAIAMQLFGRGGSDMIPLLNKGSEGIDELRAKAEELGVVMGGEDVEAGVKLNEQLKEMDAQMTAVKQRAGSDLAPSLVAIGAAMESMSSKGGILDEMFSALGVAMKGLVTFGIGVVEDFEDIAEVIVTAGVAAEQAATGNFSTAEATISIGLENMRKNAENATDALNKLWGSAEEGAKVDMGEGGGEGGWDQKQQMQLNSTKKGAQGPSQVDQWKQELQEQEEASNNFFKNNLADEDAFWTEKLSQVTAGSKEYLQVYHELYSVKKQEAQADLANSVAATKQEYEDAKSGSIERVNLANQIAQQVGQAYGYESKEYEAALTQERKAAQDWSAAQTKQLDDQLVQQQKSALGEIAVRQEAEKGKLAAGQESAGQEIAALMNMENEKYAIEMKTFDDQLVLYANDEANYRKTLDAKLAATQKHATDVAKLEEQSATATQKAWQTAISPISSAFSTSVNGMIQGTTTWQSAMARMADSVLAKFLDMGVQMVTKWAANEAARIASTESASTILQALGLQDLLAAKTTSTTEVVSDIGAQAAAAAAGAYAATAAIPFVGPELAPAAAAEAYASVMAFEGMASAAGGFYQVPGDMVANIHKDEMVLPSWAAKGVRSIIDTGQGSSSAGAGGGAGGSGSSGGSGAGGNGNNSQGSNVNLTYNVQCPDPSAFKGMIAQHADVVYDAVKKANRNGRR
jgi:hypothetical protein